MAKIIKTIIFVGVDKNHQQSYSHKHYSEPWPPSHPPHSSPVQRAAPLVFSIFTQTVAFSWSCYFFLDFEKMPVTLVETRVKS